MEMSETRLVAKEKWHEYKDAYRKTGIRVYEDLRKIYNRLKDGCKIVDINRVISKAGLHEGSLHPKLAISLASAEMVRCEIRQNGNVQFVSRGHQRYPWWNTVPVKQDIVLKNCFPSIDANEWFSATGNEFASSMDLKAPVPLIPPRFLPEKLDDSFYVLWEVDEWKMVPPEDPYLLQRVTNTHFVVLAGWNLSEVEKSAMAGRMS